MGTLVIVAHPGLHRESRANKRLADRAKQVEGVTVHDVYGRYPDGRIDVPFEQELLLQHDRIVFQFPFWWYSSPPLLKHWFDEVLTFGWAYGPGGDKLHGKEWGAAVTTGSAAEAYGREGYNRFTMGELLRPIEATARLVGAAYLSPFTVHNAMQATEAELQTYAEDYANYIAGAVKTS